MQTFLPYADFGKTAAVLDMRRLGKQRVENLQIMKALTDPGYGWQNHPAVKMWRGFEFLLMEYQTDICWEWHGLRGYKDTCLVSTGNVYATRNSFVRDRERPNFGTRPPWLGDPAFHASHRSNLLRKDEEFYRQWGWTEPTTLEYVWPV